jgi:hypothetical protein
MILDKFSKIIALVTEARAIVNDLLWKKEPSPGVKQVYLLGVLAQIQSLAVSIRAYVIEKMIAGPPGDAEAPKDTEKDTEKNFMEKLAFYREALSAPHAANVIPFERRRTKPERRFLHTFLARDRRSGIADRRRRKQASPPPPSGVHTRSS